MLYSIDTISFSREHRNFQKNKLQGAAMKELKPILGLILLLASISFGQNQTKMPMGVIAPTMGAITKPHEGGNLMGCLGLMNEVILKPSARKSSALHYELFAIPESKKISSALSAGGRLLLEYGRVGFNLGIGAEWDYKGKDPKRFIMPHISCIAEHESGIIMDWTVGYRSVILTRAIQVEDKNDAKNPGLTIAIRAGWNIAKLF